MFLNYWVFFLRLIEANMMPSQLLFLTSKSLQCQSFCEKGPSTAFMSYHTVPKHSKIVTCVYGQVLKVISYSIPRPRSAQDVVLYKIFVRSDMKAGWKDYLQ